MESGRFLPQDSHQFQLFLQQVDQPWFSTREKIRDLEPIQFNKLLKTTVSDFSPSPDESISERIVGLTDAEREEGAFRVDPAGAHTHWIPTHLRRVWDEIYPTLGVSTCLVEHHSNPINFILVDLHRPANMDGFKLKA